MLLSKQLGGGILQHHAARSQLQRLHHLLLFHRRRQQDDAHRASRAPARVQVAQRIEPSVVRHGQIEQKNVGLDLGGQFHRLEAVAGFAHHFHVAFRFEQAPQPVAENRVIVGNHNAYGMNAFIHGWPIHSWPIGGGRSVVGLSIVVRSAIGLSVAGLPVVGLSVVVLSMIRLSRRRNPYFQPCAVSRSRFYREFARQQAYSFPDHRRPLACRLQFRIRQPSGKRKSLAIVLYRQLQITRPLRQPYQHMVRATVLAHVHQALLHNARQFPADLSAPDPRAPVR